jgi:hypothetical protein
MATFKGKSGKFLKSNVHYRNIKTHTADKPAVENKADTTDHTYCVQHAVETVSSPGFVDISNVSRQEVCVCEEEDLEVDFGLADTTWGRYEKIYIIIFLPTPI